MAKIKSLGIWMDHSMAHLIGFSTNFIETKIIKSNFTHEEKELSMTKGENRMHNKEQQQQGAYYKQLSEAIMNYEEVVLFGPTNAKAELLNILKEDHHFDNIRIEVKQTDKMTGNQQYAFVREHFAQH